MTVGGRSQGVVKLFEEPELADAAVLVVDDDPGVGRSLSRILEHAGVARVDSEVEARKAVARWRETRYDAVLLDLHMPDLDGFDVMSEICDARDPEEFCPILILTGEPSPEIRIRALASGAKDFVQKPFEPNEVVARLRNLVMTGRMDRRLRSFNAELASRVSERTEEVVAAKREVLERLARAGEYRDDMTGLHANRVGDLAGLLAREIGLDEELVETIRTAAPLHDIGKIGVSDAVLLKEGPLTDDEIAHIRQHTIIGARILGASSYDLLRTASRIALTHHEFWNGEGYPKGLAGEDIPLEGRIVAVADAFDSMTNDRPYRRACAHGLAVAEIVRWRGRQFAPAVVDALCRLHQRGVLLREFPPVGASPTTTHVPLSATHWTPPARARPA